jgi:hypothetical protein
MRPAMRGAVRPSLSILFSYRHTSVEDVVRRTYRGSEDLRVAPPYSLFMSQSPPPMLFDFGLLSYTHAHIHTPSPLRTSSAQPSTQK